MSLDPEDGAEGRSKDSRNTLTIYGGEIYRLSYQMLLRNVCQRVP